MTGILNVPQTVEQALARRVSKDAQTGCWNCSGDSDDGYPRISVRDNGKRTVLRAHRYFFSRLVRPIPRGAIVLHSCDNRRCVNPAHLSIGTQSENMRDMWSKGRGPIGRGCKPADAEVKAAAKVLIAHGALKKELARAIGVAPSTISAWSKTDVR